MKEKKLSKIEECDIARVNKLLSKNKKLCFVVDSRNYGTEVISMYELFSLIFFWGFSLRNIQVHLFENIDSTVARQIITNDPDYMDLNKKYTQAAFKSFIEQYKFSMEEKQTMVTKSEKGVNEIEEITN